MSSSETKDTTEGQRIAPADIEAKFREITGDVDEKADAAKGTFVAAGAIGLVILLLAVFFFGRSRGNKKTTLVEVRRF